MDGYVLRQSLWQFCVDSADKASRDADGDWAAMQNQKLTDSQYEALHISYSTNLGMQRAFRAVIEWSNQHSVPPVGHGISSLGAGASGAGASGSGSFAANTFLPGAGAAGRGGQ